MEQEVSVHICLLLFTKKKKLRANDIAMHRQVCFIIAQFSTPCWVQKVKGELINTEVARARFILGTITVKGVMGRQLCNATSHYSPTVIFMTPLKRKNSWLSGTFSEHSWITAWEYNYGFQDTGHEDW